MHLQPQTHKNESPYAAHFGATAKRLSSYALRHKFRMLVLVLFSLVSAGTLSSIVVGSVVGLNIIYIEDEAAQKRILIYADNAVVIEDTLERFTGWRPELESRVESTLQQMRSDRSFALKLIAGFIIVVSIVGGSSRFLQEYNAGVIGANIVLDLRREMYGVLISLSHNFFEKETSGLILSRFTNDVTAVNLGLVNVFIVLFREPVKVLIPLCVAFVISPKMLLFILVFLTPLVILLSITSRHVKKRVRRRLEKIADVSSHLLETIRGISVIKSFRMESRERDVMDRQLGKLHQQLVKFASLEALTGPLTEIVIVVGTGILLVLGEQVIAAGNLSPDEFVLLAGAIVLMIEPVRKLAKVNNKLQSCIVSAERVFEYLDQTSAIREKENACDLPEIQEAIVFEHVDFSYKRDFPVLNDISFTINKGEMVALVGFSGAGKSTIAKLLPRFYDPDNGSIKIDGIDIRDATLESLRDQIGYVTQDNILFNRSIRENIAFGSETFSDERIQDAAKVAHADEFILETPHGYDTKLSEAGLNISGGQKQRVAIARAIVKDPAILILDEATSSLDTESEAAIQEAIDEFVVGRTTIVIAHRLSTVQRADRIIVLSHGGVAEQGTHHELIELGGIYSRLHKRNFAEMPDPDDDEVD